MDKQPKCESITEVEVTPEMIEAGAEELTAYDPRVESPQEAALSIFLAMIKAKLQSHQR